MAVLAVSIVSNLASVLISLYYSYEEYGATKVFNGIFSMVSVTRGSEGVSEDEPETNVVVTLESESNMVIKDVKTNNGTIMFEMYDNGNGETIYITQTLVDSLSRDNVWLQIVNGSGEEIGSFNKPEGIKTTYKRYELDKAVTNTIKVSEYIVKAVYDKTGSENPADQITFVVGIPKPDFDLETVAEYNMDYFRHLDTRKAVSTVVTLVVALLLGYLFAIRLNRPVVRITDGIATMAEGNYDVKFPDDKYYKEVFRSLNHMAGVLKAAELEREKTERMREEWITNISHDMKTPLSSIKGYGELLYETGCDMSDDELRNYIRVVLEKSAYMDSLINDLKLAQRLKNEAFPLNRKRENLTELLRETIIDILNDPRFEERHINFDPEPEDVYIEFDSHLFKRAFTNLIMNAAVHNGADTEIWVRIRRNDKITVEITDNGNGIAPADQEKLFERYYRGTSTNDFYDGSGLGLAIAKEIIEAHGGTIDLESTVGEGTTVRISLFVKSKTIRINSG